MTNSGRTYSGLVIRTGNDAVHYGVMGMKWGVRRAIGKASREAYRVGKLKKGADLYVEKTKRKIEEKKSYGGTVSPKLSERLARGKFLAKKYTDRYSKLTEGMSEKDIRQGKRGAIGRSVLTAALLGPLGTIVVEGAMLARASDRARG